MAVRLISFVASTLIVFQVQSADFAGEEYLTRLQKAQDEMVTQGMGALLLTMEVHHRYFTGVASEFWSSPTRPFFLVIPATGNITAVVPGISETLYSELSHTVGSVQTWAAPRPEDDGVSKVELALRSALAASPGSVGAELGHELQMRMPVADFQRLEASIADIAPVADAGPILKRLRAVKSEAEIAVQASVCKAQSHAMRSVGRAVRPGMTEKEWCRQMRIELLRAGVDRVQYMACRSAPGGYKDIVGAASDRKLLQGDMLVIDTGSMVGDYFCDFNRNFFVGSGPMDEELVTTQAALYRAITAGIEAAVPGRTTADLFHAMAGELPGPASSVGRFGHGVGLAITEWPSILPASAGLNVTLQDGMVFSIEPSANFGSDGHCLVHEEVIVVREGGGQLLSERAPSEIPRISTQLSDSEGDGPLCPDWLYKGTIG